MADDVTTQTAALATIPDATTIATDEASGARHVQLVKLAEPTGGSATAWGDVADGLPVQVGAFPSGAKTFSTAAPTSSAASALAANASRKSALFYNNGSQVVYLGGSSGVTTGNGLPLPAGQYLADVVSTDAWWAIVASGTGDLRIVEVA